MAELGVAECGDVLVRRRRARAISRAAMVVVLATSAGVVTPWASRQANAIAPASTPSLTLLTADGHLMAIDTLQPTVARSSVTITGLVAGDAMVAIDVRPQTGGLYGLGYNSTTHAVRLYHVSEETGRAAAVGSPGTFVAADGTTPVAIDGVRFGIDFEPGSDRLTVVTTTGQDFRINPNTGAFVDDDLGGAPGSVPGTNMRAALAAGADGVAFTDPTPGSASTFRFVVDSAADTVYAPNSALTPVSLRLNGSTVNVTAAGDIDMTPADSFLFGYTVMTIGGVTDLYDLDLTSGALHAIGRPGGSAPIGLAIQLGQSWATAMTYGGTQLVSFDPSTPTSTTTVAVSGVTAGERLVGIDARPSTGQLYGLGVNAATDIGTLYVLDPRTGSAIPVGGSSGLVFLQDFDGVTKVNLSDDTLMNSGIDFDPVEDVLRVVDAGTLNYRISPVTGSVVDGNWGQPSNPGVNGDGVLNPGFSSAMEIAYTNSEGGATATTAYTINTSLSIRSLSIQSPPASGHQSLVATMDIAPGGAIGFDIPSGIDVATSGSVAVGYGYVVSSFNSVTFLWRLNLTDGTTDKLGTVGNGAAFYDGLVIWTVPPPLRFIATQPNRVADTRQGQGGVRLAAGETRAFAVGPGDAITMNVTAVDPAGSGYLTVYPCGDRPATSSLNYTAGRTTPNQVTVGTRNGQVCVFTLAATDVLIDTNGYWTAAGGSAFVPAPDRLWDTRTQGGFAGSVLQLDLTTRSTTIGTLTAVSLNVTATEVGEESFVTVWPCASPQPGVSNLNPRAGDTVPNHVTVLIPSNDRRVCLFVSHPLQLIVDITGWWSTTAPQRLLTYAPDREADTRFGNPVAKLDANTVTQVITPRPATLVANVTVSGASFPGFLAVFPCAAGYQGTSTVNFGPLQDVANATLVDASSGVCVFSNTRVDVIIDTAGAIA